MMKLFDQAHRLITPPVILEDFQEYDSLLAKAKGEEADRIGDLYTVLVSNAEPEVYEQYVMQSIGES